MIRVRLFAAAADAAGVEETAVAASTLSEARAELSDRFGTELSRILEQCSFLLDGRRLDTDAPLPDGATLDALPPFAGG